MNTRSASLAPSMALPRSAATRRDHSSIDRHGTGSWVRRGFAVLAALGALVGGFMLVPITGAIVASGVVIVEGDNKAVQHLDGGIVAAILVRNGDRVREGDVLIRLDPTAARANLAITEARIDEARIQKARLEAERDEREHLDLPATLRNRRATPSIAQTLRTQEALLAARLAMRKGSRAAATEREAQLIEAMAGLETQLSARRREAELITTELGIITPLFEQGYASRQRVIPLQRDMVRLEGDVERLKSELQRTRGSIEETRQRVRSSEAEVLQATVDELRKTDASLTELGESRAALADRLARAEIRAPATGRVHALAHHTIGGIVQPATAIMQIVPESARLIIEARVSPRDADKIREGQPAHVRFPSFDARSTPRLAAHVIRVSAAQHTDPQGRAYFTADLSLSREELARLPPRLALAPGMPADAFIETDERSVVTFLVRPLADALARTFREH